MNYHTRASGIRSKSWNPEQRLKSLQKNSGNFLLTYKSSRNLFFQSDHMTGIKIFFQIFNFWFEFLYYSNSLIIFFFDFFSFWFIMSLLQYGFERKRINREHIKGNLLRKNLWALKMTLKYYEFIFSICSETNLAHANQ